MNAGVFAGVEQATVVQMVLKGGIVNITQQLLQMSLGNTHHFDMRSLLVSMGSAFVNIKLNELTPTNIPFADASVMSDVNSVATGFLSSVAMGGHIDIKSIAANAIGNVIGNSLGRASVRMLQATALYQQVMRQNLEQEIMADRALKAELERERQETESVEPSTKQLNSVNAKTKVSDLRFLCSGIKLRSNTFYRSFQKQH